MEIIYPQDVTPTTLTSSNVPETDNPVWSASTTYAVGAKVMLNHRNYESLLAGNINRNPATDTVTPPAWLDAGATNRWKMFDNSVGSLTTNPGSIVVVITPGKVVNSLAMFNLAGRTVRVTMVDPVDGLVYDKTMSLVDAGVLNWYDYFFTATTVHTDIVVKDLPAYGTASLSITVSAGAEVAAVGHLALGLIKDLGCTDYGATAGAISFSRKDRDAFGNAVIVKRSNAKRAGFDISFPTAQLATIQRLLAALDAVPVVWIGSPLPEYEGTVVFGFYRDFDLNYEGPKTSRGSITIEGMT